MPFDYDLTYDSSIWAPINSSGGLAWQPYNTAPANTPTSYWGWQGLSNSGASYITYPVVYSTGTCGIQNNQQYQEWQYGPLAYNDKSGSHTFSAGGVYFNSSACGQNPSGGWYGPTPGFQPPNPQAPATATDGSGLTLNYTPSFSGSLSISAYITTKNGVTIYAPVVNNPPAGQGSYSAEDANGNEINAVNGAYTDTLGQTALSVLGTEPSNTTLTYTAPSGAAAIVTVSYVPYTIKTNFKCSGVAEYGPTSVNLVDKVTLPDGTFYQFNYEQTPGASGDYTGRLLSVTLPTGGSITYGYNYSDGNNGIVCADGSTDGLTRTLSPGGPWNYTRQVGTGGASTTTVQDPASNQTVLNFQGIYETERQAYQGTSSSGNLLVTKLTCYYNSGNQSGPCPGTYTGTPFTQITTIQQYPNNGLQSENITRYDPYQSITEMDQYAYAATAPGSLLQKTIFNYISLGAFPDLVSSVTVTDGNSNLLSETTYSYDEYSTYPLQSTTGTPQHGNVTGSRGNVTSIYRYSTATAKLASHYQYYDTGNVYKAYDVNNAITTYVNGTAAQGNSTISCGNSFPTTANLPISGLSTSNTWNCTGGVAATVNTSPAFTDLNGNSTNVTYNDSYFWRPASTEDAALNTTSVSYTPASTSTPASIENRMLFNSNSSISEQLTTLDGFGRPYLSQQEQTPTSTSYDTSETNYDSSGRPYQWTMPYVGTAGQTTTVTPLTTNTYNTLGHLTLTTDGGGGTVNLGYNQNDVLQTIGPAPTGENTKQKQSEYDALGRLTSVCEITGGIGNGACAQTNPTTPYNGYWTKYVYDFSNGYSRMTVTQNAQSSSTQTRVYLHDLLGRLVSETNPESGTTSYTFDSASGCSGSSSGDLIKRVDQKGTTTCYTYDSLHRVTSVTYSDGTPTKTLVYDSASLNSTAMSNAKGHMAEAYTGSSGSKITDEFFSYSARGELTDVYEFTPHSGSTYYHVTASFWANGGLNSLTSNLSSVPSQTYGVDGEGRPYSVTAGSGVNPVSSTSYNLSTYTDTVNFPSLDSDVFTLDPNTGRMTKYKFNVSTKADTGALTWNANGSLKKLVITDTVPGTSDAQTCNYTHDDLARIASANCGSSIWTQTFSYDSFGNLSQSGTSNFLPSYTGTSAAPGTTPTNQYYQIPGGPTGVSNYYDADGRVIDDVAHSYTWDAESKMISVDTTTITYDALGRMVEKNVGGTYTQIVYSPQGKKFALMNGQTLQKAYIPLPTGAKAVYTSTGLTYYQHHDHLSTSRLATTPSRTMYSSTAYGPYAEPYAQAGTTDLSFTGQDQDTVSGMYDFRDRKYNPVQGRWLSPDPMGLGAVDPTSPQSWNRYAYVNNNPLAMVDPFGDDGCYSMGDAACEGQYYGGGPNLGDPNGGYSPSSSAPGLNPTNGSVQNTDNATSGQWTTPGSPNEFDVLDGELANGITPGTAHALAALNAIASSVNNNPDSANSGLADYFPGAFNGLPPGPSWAGQCTQDANAIAKYLKIGQQPPESLLIAVATCAQP